MRFVKSQKRSWDFWTMKPCFNKNNPTKSKLKMLACMNKQGYSN